MHRFAEVIRIKLTEMGSFVFKFGHVLLKAPSQAICLKKKKKKKCSTGKPL